MFSHRFHGSTQIVWVRKIVAEVSGLRSSKVPPTDFTDLHRTACWGCSPTEYAEFTELLAEDVLPQIAQIYTEAANFRGCTQTICVDP